MEETKLDKAVAKFVNGFEYTINIIKKIFNSSGFFILLFSFYLIGLSTHLWLLVFHYEKLGMSFLLNSLTFLSSGFLLYTKLRSISDIDLKILKFSRKLYSEESVKFCFEPIIADWKKEYSSSNKWQSGWISIRYGFAFISAMFMQSYFGRLLELIRKLGK